MHIAHASLTLFRFTGSFWSLPVFSSLNSSRLLTSHKKLAPHRLHNRVFFAFSCNSIFSLLHLKECISISATEFRAPGVCLQTLSGTPNSKTDESPSATGCLRKSTTDEVPHRETPGSAPISCLCLVNGNCMDGGDINNLASIQNVASTPCLISWTLHLETHQ